MKIAMLGLGIIGESWAKNLQADGLEVRAWNRTPKQVAGFEPSVVKAATGADFIFVVVADPPAVGSVLEQIRPALKAGQTIIQSSTISAAWTRKFAAEVEAAGARFLEAPFTGSKGAALERKTVFYLGGDAALIEHARPVLARLSQKLFHIGPLGSASSLKLAMNLNIAQIAEALCESLALARSEGISDETFFEVLRMNVSHSGVANLKEPKLRDGDYSPQFSIKHMRKDLALAVETAGDLKLPQTETVLDIFNRAIADGRADDDFIGIMSLLKAG